MQAVFSYECIGVFVSGSCDVALFSIPVVQCNCENSDIMFHVCNVFRVVQASKVEIKTHYSSDI